MSENKQQQNKKSVSFSIVGDIVTKQRPRAAVIGGFARVYTSKDTIYYENYVKTVYQSNCIDKDNDNKLITFNDLPLYVEITAYFKAPKQYEKLKEQVYDLPCMKNKDLDNIAKIILDSLNGIAYNDDKQVRSLLVQKYWTNDEEKIDVFISQDGLSTDEFMYSFKASQAFNEYMSETKKEIPDNKRIERLYKKYQKILFDKKSDKSV